MLFIRQLLSVVLMMAALALLVFLAGFWGARYWGKECEVSQVFKLSKSIPLAGQNYLGVYDVAITPIAPNEMAQTCSLYTVTPVKYMNLLDKHVWLMPLEEYQFAYFETPQAGTLHYLLLGAAVLLVAASFFLFKEKAG
ncbi:MAG TPA: hypothetical protein VJ873_00815 [bacterium]|nr:hypothetical protein [bacterium]